jgi:AraC-like DNA-binding protein
MQGEQSTLGSMIQVVRMAAGSQWNPPAVWIESPRSEWALHSEGLAQSRVDFGGPVLAIAIQRDLLDRRLPRPPWGRTTTEEAGAPVASDLAGSLLQALAPLASDIPLSLGLGAEIAETTPRTPQRWLAEERTSWRQIADRARFEACEKLMLDSSLTLTEISKNLGYSDHAHFTRAFCRWTGETPSVRRQRTTDQNSPAASEGDADVPNDPAFRSPESSIQRRKLPQRCLKPRSRHASSCF